MPDIHHDESILLDVRNLKVYFPVYRGLLRRIVGYTKAVDGVNFFIQKGEILGLVGESGCGKTTTGRAVIRLIEPTEGEVFFRDQKGQVVNLLDMEPAGMKSLIRKDAQIIFQDPYSSLNPRMTINNIIAEPMRIHQMGDRRFYREKVQELLELVGLSAYHMQRYPNEFSGGQRQRIGIARALALNPRLIICDEPVSALDVSVQAQVLNLLKELQKKLGLTLLFIAHDLSVIYHMSDRVVVMYLGKITEVANKNELYENPKHPYTEALMSAIPIPDPDVKPNHILLTGEIPDPSDTPSGCAFHPRCHYAKDICRKESPKLIHLPSNEKRFVSCHRTKELCLRTAASQNLTTQR